MNEYVHVCVWGGATLGVSVGAGLDSWPKPYITCMLDSGTWTPNVWVILTKT